MSDENEKLESKEQSTNGPILTEQTIPRAQNPAVFLVILALVLILGLIVGVYKRDTVIVDTEAERPAIGGDVSARERALQDIPMLDVIKQTSASQVAEDAAPSCEFPKFIGRKYDDRMGQIIKDAGNSERPLRILKPGDAYTQDFAPNRVNINLDEAGVITRIWCG